MANDIVRSPGERDLNVFDVPISIPGEKTTKSPRDKFLALMAIEQQKAQKTIDKDGFPHPFAARVVQANVEDMIAKFELRWKRQGYVDKNFKWPNIDWEKYSDLKNFKIVEEKLTQDKHLSKANRLPVFFKTRVYKYFDKESGVEYENIYRVMESEESALIRAQQKVENRLSSKKS